MSGNDEGAAVPASELNGAKAPVLLGRTISLPATTILKEATPKAKERGVDYVAVIGIGEDETMCLELSKGALEALKDYATATKIQTG